MNKHYPFLAALAYTIFVGLSFLVTKWVVPFASPLLILAHRFTTAFITYIVFLLISKQRLQLKGKIILTILPVTIFYPLLYFTLQLYGLTYATSAEGGIIFATVPILTVLIAILSGKRPSLIEIISIFLSVSGVIFIITRNMASAESNSKGILLLFLSALCFALYTTMLGRILTIASVHQLTFVLIITGCIVFNLMFALQAGNSGKLLSQYLEPFLSFNYVLAMIFLGSLASVLASLFSNYALKYLSAPQFSVFTNLSTLVSIAAGALLLKESLYYYHFLGGALILTGVAGTNFSDRIRHFLRGFFMF